MCSPFFCYKKQLFSIFDRFSLEFGLLVVTEEVSRPRSPRIMVHIMKIVCFDTVYDLVLIWLHWLHKLYIVSGSANTLLMKCLGPESVVDGEMRRESQESLGVPMTSCACIRIHRHVCVHTHIHVHMCIYIYMYIYVRVCVYIYIFIQTCFFHPYFKFLLLWAWLLFNSCYYPYYKEIIISLGKSAFWYKIMLFLWKSCFSYANHDFHKKSMLFIRKTWFSQEKRDFLMKIMLFLWTAWFSYETHDFHQKIMIVVFYENHAFHKKIMIILWKACFAYENHAFLMEVMLF